MKKITAAIVMITLALIITKLFIGNPWIEMNIPGAVCGDGNAYKVFYAKGKKKNISIELMGGGACWSDDTCWGPGLRTWIHPIVKMPYYSYLSSKAGPVGDYTKVYFPYCTGDVWSGKHMANYSSAGPTYHYGQANFQKALNTLEEHKIINFKDATKVLVSGSSAGAIGALLHLPEIDNKLNKDAKRLLILDSPGLHWNKDFWDLFSADQLEDLLAMLHNVGIKTDKNKGVIASELARYCDHFPNWNINFIQSTEDIIMARLFGNMSFKDHEKNVLGPHGLKETLKDTPNCQAFITPGKGHAFLLLKQYSEITRDIDDRESIKDYVDRLIKERL